MTHVTISDLGDCRICARLHYLTEIVVAPQTLYVQEWVGTECGVRATKWKYLHDQKRCPGFVQIRWSHEDSLNILEPQQNLNEIY